MADARFFTPAASATLQEIAALTGAALASGGERIFTDVAPLDRAGASDISFLDNVKYLDQFAASQAGACFVRPKFATRAPQGMLLLVTEEPYYAYAQTAQRFYPEPKGSGISPQAAISPGARIGKDVSIGAFTVIEDGVEIGDGSRIGALCSISHAIIGKRAIIHRSVHIGQDGFGFAPGKKGVVKVPQLGRVIIGDDVEIGSGTCVDRGAGPDTVIGSSSKIDNLVQIGHNVQIGKYVFIAAQTGIAGSTLIDDGVMIGGQAGFSGHIHVGAGAKIAARSGVMTDVPPGATYGGGPAIPARDWHRQTVAIANLVKKKSED